MEVNFVELQALIQEAIESALKKQGPPLCPLLDVGISHDTHKEHHIRLKKLFKDASSIQQAFIAGVLVTISGGILGLLWPFLSVKIRTLFGG